MAVAFDPSMVNTPKSNQFIVTLCLIDRKKDRTSKSNFATCGTRLHTHIQLPGQYFGSNSKPINFFKNIFPPVCRAWGGKDFGSINLELITQEVIENLKIVIIGYEQNQYFHCQKGAEVKTK
jgi:predicted lipid-binding transport protein (Tim44 family)